MHEEELFGVKEDNKQRLGLQSPDVNDDLCPERQETELTLIKVEVEDKDTPHIKEEVDTSSVKEEEEPLPFYNKEEELMLSDIKEEEMEEIVTKLVDEDCPSEESSSSSQHITTEGEKDHCKDSQEDGLLAPISDDNDAESHSPHTDDDEEQSEGVNLAVFRGEDGKAHVLDAYCPHLGANLAVGGRVVGSCIECPFHGWQFQGDSGKCENIPYAEKVPDFAKVDVWHSCEVNGQILVWFHCDGEEPQWTVPEQEEITKGEWVYRGRTEHYVNAHIEEIPENAADLSHLTYLHTPGIVSGVDLRYTKNKTWQFVQHHWKAQWASESSPFNHCSQMLLKHSLHVFGIHWPLLDLHVVARQVGPGLVFLRFDHSFLGSGMIMQSVTPVEPLLQCVSHTIFYQSNIPAFVPKFILKGESIQFERDVMIWNNKTYISKPLLVKEDSTIRKHRRWYSQFYSENSPRFQYQRDTLEF
ncbi:cholesterol 7-desaturase nvd isoform X2 [Corythoichthys intestinalis]|uniref:cholesterol 7-desaturase nvd isoform X2 n=1 Tax=Corythoichthys intestinalis TaxID=161448 RepID=UPI0025A64500|nr:cholesterol 7-desaturase nvd isoform X2 [Corythoichthys intestinalis]